MKIAIIDYGAGNTMSVLFALQRIGCQAEITDNEQVIRNADGVIFPGVGHALPAMQQLKAKGLDKLIPELKQPVLGICLGMQLMCNQSEEGEVKGLGIFNVKVKKFTAELKVPQIGWNSCSKSDSDLLMELGGAAYFYFVHSYYVPICNETISMSEYGIDFTAALQKNNFYACQFHPEKSGAAGEQLLKNFKNICESYQQ